MVSGADSSALVRLAKIRNYCEQHGATLVCCSLSQASHAAMTRGGFFGGKSRHQYLDDLNLALAWCEDQMLTNAGMELDSTVSSFECWLQRQLGAEVSVQELMKFLVRKDFDKSQAIYRQGEPADTIDLAAVGHLLIEIASVTGQGLRVRRTATHTVIGEMGFFRKSPRSATVSSDGASVLFTLTRDALNSMRRDRADLANALDDFIMRVLADRIDSANRQVAALEPSFTHFLPEK
jgi:SulP family sulfate permease